MQKVLVLDDIDTIRVQTGIHLKKRGLQPILTGTVEEALKILESDGEIVAGVLDWNLDPDGTRGGPYTEPVARHMLERNFPVLIRSGTNDETGMLKQLQMDFADANLLEVMEKGERGPELGEAIRGFRIERG